MHRVLVVEDDPAILSNTARMLRLEGFEVHVARNGVEGLARARQVLPDLILCDVRMPEMNGDELLEHLRADPATETVPLIFATASAESSGQQERIARGAAAYLVKPYDFKTLLTTIAQLLK